MSLDCFLLGYVSTDLNSSLQITGIGLYLSHVKNTLQSFLLFIYFLEVLCISQKETQQVTFKITLVLDCIFYSTDLIVYYFSGRRYSDYNSFKNNSY